MFSWFKRSALNEGSQADGQNKSTVKAEFNRKKDIPDLAKKDNPTYITIGNVLLDTYKVQTLDIFGRICRVFLGNPVREYLFASKPFGLEKGGIIPAGATLIPVISAKKIPREVIVGAYKIDPTPINTDMGIVLFRIEKYIEAQDLTKDDINEIRRVYNAVQNMRRE